MDDDSWGIRWESRPIGGGGPVVKVEITAGSGYEGDPLGFDLLARGIVKLIEEFDTHFLSKDEGDTETLHFYASIMSALARHYVVDDADPDLEDVQRTVQDVLQEMIEVLTQAGMLQETVRGGPDDEEWSVDLGRASEDDWDDDWGWEDEDDDADEA